jgi:hypothetical protein
MNLFDEINIVSQLISLPAGYDLGYGCLIGIKTYSHPKWVVEWEHWFHNEQRKLEFCEFDNAKDAAEFFVNKRHELKIGLEYEREDLTKV